MNIGEALDAARTLGLARLDAQLLLLHALRRPASERAWLIAHDGQAIDEPAAERFRRFSRERLAGVPLAYIVGVREFYGLQLQVDRRVLVPRPETEILVRWVVEAASGLARAGLPKILDLGTGSGAIAIAVARSLAATGIAAEFVASDAGAEALSVARGNSSRLGCDIEFIHSDWFEKVSGRFHVIASNPPYVAADDPHLASLANEPLQALVAGKAGLDAITEIVRHAPAHLMPGGWLLLEHGYDQAGSVRRLLKARGFTNVTGRLDLAGIERCSGGQWPDDAHEPESAG